MQLLGGAYFSNDPYSKVTSISKRDLLIGVTFDLFYHDSWNTEKKWESKAVAILAEIEDKWVKQKLFNVEGKDSRVTWATFGDTDITKCWPLYYDNEKRYTDLRKVKTRFDKGNVFHNEFTIPPLE